ncbi:MAG: transcription elongation factor GreB [Oceanospirillaceae bacterium]|nr:transcription elongation factor GreB [Oceanospirillaceae bacterium]
MSRWRPPAPRSAPYITREGYDRLTAELKHLWKEKRPSVTQAVKEAAAQGDRSENAEYIYGKKQLREIDRRIRYLSKRLDSITVVDRQPEERDRVFFGAWVTLEDESGATRRHRIVGADEIGDQPGYISVDAPLARLLLKKQAGDEVWLRKPDGNEEWFEIIEIEYF